MNNFELARERAKTPGSTILTKWLADRQAARSQVQVNAQSCSSSNPSEFNDLFLSGISNAGPSVTENTVKQLAVVNACIGLIGGAIASMPLHSYEYTDDDERTRVRDDLSYMLNESPMPNWVASSFWEYIMQSKLLHGDGLARIHRASRMSTTIVGFEPINPTKVLEVKKDGPILIYTYVDEDGRLVTVDHGDMLHFPSMGFDGKRSPSALRYGLRNAAGTALAADEYSARFFSNGARPDYFLTTDSPIKPESIAQIRDELQRKYGGVSRSHLPGVLSGGLKVEQITMPHEDAQLLATRGFQIEEIARAFNVPPFLIGHNEKTTSFGKGIEEMGRMFVQYTLLRHLNPIRQETTRKIYSRKSGLFVEHNTAALERGDLKTRFEAYRVAIGRAGEPGWMTVNEARRLENWKSKDGGDELTNGAINDGNATA